MTIALLVTLLSSLSVGREDYVGALPVTRTALALQPEPATSDKASGGGKGVASKGQHAAGQHGKAAGRQHDPAVRGAERMSAKGRKGGKGTAASATRKGGGSAKGGQRHGGGAKQLRKGGRKLSQKHASAVALVGKTTSTSTTTTAAPALSTTSKTSTNTATSAAPKYSASHPRPVILRGPVANKEQAAANLESKHVPRLFVAHGCSGSTVVGHIARGLAQAAGVPLWLSVRASRPRRPNAHSPHPQPPRSALLCHMRLVCPPPTPPTPTTHTLSRHAPCAASHTGARGRTPQRGVLQAREHALPRAAAERQGRPRRAV